jgi:hypothetical protein
MIQIADPKDAAPGELLTQPQEVSLDRSSLTLRSGPDEGPG